MDQRAAHNVVQTILSVQAPADFHVHLRQGAMNKLVTPHVREGGFQLGYVMPNLTPPIMTVDQAETYHKELQKIDPNVEWMMTLYLSPSLTVEEIARASESCVYGVKSYPRGVTTNSDGGIESYEQYYPIFAAMQEHGLVLNLHGEVPSNPLTNTTVLNAEPHFLPHLHALHRTFPRLRIVLEHVTTRAAVDAVRQCGDTVAATITAHHLALVVDDWAGQGFHYCKPVAKGWEDREALRAVIREGHPRFFLGSDSAPHPHERKAHTTPSQGCAAGIYTSPILLPLVAHFLEDFGALHNLENFVSTFGRAFYKQELADGTESSVVMLKRVGSLGEEDVGVKVAESFEGEGERVVPFWAGKRLRWEIAQS